MDASESIPRPKDCPDCGAPFPEVGISCWLCGWKLGDPVGVLPWVKPPSKENPYTSPAPPPDRGDLKWTFSLSTLFLWTALVAVVMGVVRIAPGLGIMLGIISFPAAILTISVASYRKRRSGRALTVPEKILAFVESFALFFLIATAVVVAAIGALAVICLSSTSPSNRLGVDNGSLLLTIFGCAAGFAVIVFIVCFLARTLWRSKG